MAHQTYDKSVQDSNEIRPFHRYEMVYKKIKHIFLGLFTIFTCTFFILMAISVFYFQHLTDTTIHLSDKDLRLNLLHIVGDEDIDNTKRNILEEYNHSTNTLIVGPNQVSPHVIKALTSSEDSLFFYHNGILPKAIVRAVGQDIFNTEDPTGGSTITQQLVKNQLLTNERTYDRKANELVLSMRAEHVLTKDEIIYTYLNIVPFGRDNHGSDITGIASASYSLFGKSATNLNIAESAYLIGLLQSPYYYTPYTEDGSLKPDQEIKISLNRQHYVLKRMLVEEKITPDDFKNAEKYNVQQHLITR
ncbi:transglycosylase [Staphylococcus succinus]|uniref:transglycosylase domain-containing protein n=1 Tax=Staphylococcus succinus TaxID=61015 RepID=UPI000C32C228|nr:penicillin-binding protein [Staphylococcus succinus]PKI23469.1 transglycosylase [Staphylococcus succinus]PTI44874.1 penicillin-binding protein [Staphylococcus succinus]PTJ84832.1 penicillin-binding protein [Staphylococcus succinus]